MAILANAGSATFVELKAALEATQGNLSIQLKKLEEAGYVSTTRRLKGNKTETKAELTDAGRTAFSEYLARMDALIQNTKF